MRLTSILTVISAAASTALAAPASPQASPSNPSLNTTKPFQIAHLSMAMDSVWDPATGTSLTFTITDPNSGVSTPCSASDVLGNTAYACERSQASWNVNYDFSTLSVEWTWSPGELVSGSEAYYRGNGTASVDWNCASSGSSGQQCFANGFGVKVQRLSGWD